MPNAAKTFLILDGNALLHRAWHAIPPLTTQDGRVVNAVYGFTMVVEKMLAQFKPDFMAVAWDLPGGTFRHVEYADYKATREKKAQELYDQIPMIQDVLGAYGIPSISVPGFEGDDIIGTVAAHNKKQGYKTLIVTGDLDALQLVDDMTHVVFFVKGLSQTTTYDPAAVQARYSLRPDQLIDLKTFIGDASDNLPGVAGIGEKTALELLNTHGTVKGVFDALKKGEVLPKYAKKLEGKEEVARQMCRLVTIVRDVDLDGFDVSTAVVRAPDLQQLLPMLRDLEFKTLLKKYEGEPVVMSAATSLKTEKRKALASAAKIEDLDLSEIAVFVVPKAKDLFGGSIASIALTDGKKTFVLDDPDAEKVERVINVLAKAAKIVAHDWKATLHVLEDAMVLDELIEVPVFDTMVAAYLLAAGDRAFDYADVVRAELSVSVGDAAVERASTLLPLAIKLEDRLVDEKMSELAKTVEMPLVTILYRMERHGIEVDSKKLNDLSAMFDEKLQELTKQIYKLAGREFNINSPSQLADILFVDLALPTKGIKKTKSGFSTAAPELEKLEDAHAIIPLIGEYREIAKLKGTYADTLPTVVEKDGRIHARFNQCVAATGRLSGDKPNLQNIPIRTELGLEIRKAFVAPKDHFLVSADYSQIELRLAAAIARDKSFIEAFKDGADIHRRTAAEMWGIPEEKVTKGQRSAAKAINFGILYGIGPRSLSRSAGVSFDEAKDFIDRYFVAHPGIASYLDEMKVRAHADGYVSTPFGRRRYLRDINSGVPQLVAAAERMAINMPVQGASADIIKMAMRDIEAWLKQGDLRVKMLLQVHDELVFEVHQDDLAKAEERIREIMEQAVQLEVPLDVDVQHAKTWGDMN